MFPLDMLGNVPTTQQFDYFLAYFGQDCVSILFKNPYSSDSDDLSNYFHIRSSKTLETLLNLKIWLTCKNSCEVLRHRYLLVRVLSTRILLRTGCLFRFLRIMKLSVVDTQMLGVGRSRCFN